MSLWFKRYVRACLLDKRIRTFLSRSFKTSDMVSGALKLSFHRYLCILLSNVIISKAFENGCMRNLTFVRLIYASRLIRLNHSELCQTKQMAVYCYFSCVCVLVCLCVKSRCTRTNISAHAAQTQLKYYIFVHILFRFRSLVFFLFHHFEKIDKNTKNETESN